MMAEPRGDEVVEEEEEKKKKRPVLLEWRSSRGFIILSVGVAMFTVSGVGVVGSFE